jgi:hypothetical protein
VGTNEYIQLLANWEYLKRAKQYSCKEQTLSPERTEAFKNRNGCGFRITNKPRQTLGVINYHSCFCDHLHDNFGHLLYLHENFNKGILPFPGSLSDQPNHVIEIFRVLDRLKFDHEKEQNEKNKQ